MTPSAGDVIADRYAVREEIGSGGFSTVWLAHDRRFDRAVALKCPDVGTHDREQVLGRFRREVEVLEPFADAITPSGIVRYLDENLDDDPRYIAFEYLPGDPLSDSLGTGELGTGIRQRIVEDLAETLDFLHRNDVVYLDLKPENVVLRPSGRPVLLDFNTAVRLPDPIETRFGADQFKPPELLRDGIDADPGPWSDVYAWGKLAFYLLSGVKVLTENVPDEGLDPLDFGASCSRALADVVRRATVPDPDERTRDGPAVRDGVGDATGIGPRALLTHLGSDVTCSVRDGHAMGRLSGDVHVPWVVLPDPEQHVSPRHAEFRRTVDGWVVEDTSLNGTYVGFPDDWTFVLSEEGHRRRQESGRGSDVAPPSAVRVPSGVQLSPVHPEYGIRLELTIPDR